MLSGMPEYFVITMAAIFVIVNPFTTAFAFANLTYGNTREKNLQIAREAAIIAASLFFLFAILGSLIFQIFGISIGAFRIAGGIILFGIGMGMISRQEDEEMTVRKRDVGEDVSVIPLAIPFISGPGSIATVMILTSEAPTLMHTLVIYLAILLTVFTCYIAMRYSKSVIKRLGKTGQRVMTRLFGLILSVVAIQFVINGVIDVLPAVMAAVGP